MLDWLVASRIAVAMYCSPCLPVFVAVGRSARAREGGDAGHRLRFGRGRPGRERGGKGLCCCGERSPPAPMLRSESSRGRGMVAAGWGHGSCACSAVKRRRWEKWPVSAHEFAAGLAVRTVGQRSAVQVAGFGRGSSWLRTAGRAPLAACLRLLLSCFGR